MHVRVARARGVRACGALTSVRGVARAGDGGATLGANACRERARGQQEFGADQPRDGSSDGAHFGRSDYIRRFIILNPGQAVKRVLEEK